MAAKHVHVMCSRSQSGSISEINFSGGYISNKEIRKTVCVALHEFTDV